MAHISQEVAFSSICCFCILHGIFEIPAGLYSSCNVIILPQMPVIFVIRKNGDEIAILMTMSRKNLGSQKVIVMTARDQSGTKQIEEALDESREKYRQLTNRLNIGVFRTAAEGGFRFLEHQR